MKISCPQCDKEYELPTELPGVNPVNVQKPVQCAHCHGQIFPADESRSLPMKSVKSARRIIVMPSEKFDQSAQKPMRDRSALLKKAQMLASAGQIKPDQDADGSAEIHVESTAEWALAPGGQSDEVTNPTEQVAGLLDDEIKAAYQPSSRQGWVNMAAVIGAILIFGGGLMVRDRVVSVLPDFSNLYQLTGQLAGFGRNSHGLEFASVTSKTELKNGGNILIIEGMIRNISNKAVKVPAVRLLMRTADKQEIYSWFHEPQQMRLQAGETMIFTTQLFGPPSDVQDVHLKFTERRKQQAKLN